VIVGSGGYGREVLSHIGDLRRAGAPVEAKGFLDDDPAAAPSYRDVPLLGDTKSYRIAADDRLIIAVGDPVQRLHLAVELTARGACFITLVHPSAQVAESATIGAGCIVGPLCVVGNDAFVDDHALLTSTATVGHDAFVGRYSLLSPYAVVNGEAEIGDGVFLGAHASINPAGSVGAWSKVAAGAVVYDAAPAGSMSSGNPATSVAMGYDLRVGVEHR
jgi:sugar O-acyltransferase (sialic acid O-acetyltransferase NeuD family)